MLPPPLPHQLEILARVVDRVRTIAAEGAAPPLVVLGLDGALLDSRPRTLQILFEFAEVVRTELPDIAESLSALELEGVHHFLRETLQGCRLDQATLVKQITMFWHERFYTDEYLTLDQPVPGAVELADRLHRAGATLVYLTSRDLAGMLVGTVESLRDLRFPYGVPGVELVMKPDATVGDDAFKRSVLPSLARLGEVVAVFDAEPATCVVATERFANANIGLVDTWRVSAEVPAGIEVLRDLRMGA